MRIYTWLLQCTPSHEQVRTHSSSLNVQRLDFVVHNFWANGADLPKTVGGIGRSSDCNFSIQ